MDGREPLDIDLRTCNYMTFGTMHMLANISTDILNVVANNSSIELVEKLKYLGVRLDPELTFTKYVTKHVNIMSSLD